MATRAASKRENYITSNFFSESAHTSNTSITGVI